MRSPIETKVAAGGITGLAVTLILQLLQTYVHGFHSPPAATVAAAVTTLTAVVAYYAPHTPRGAETPAAVPAVPTPAPAPAAAPVAVVAAPAAVPAPAAQPTFEVPAGTMTAAGTQTVPVTTQVFTTGGQAS